MELGDVSSGSAENQMELSQVLTQRGKLNLAEFTIKSTRRQTEQGWVYIKLYRGSNTIRLSLSSNLQRAEITFDFFFSCPNVQRVKEMEQGQCSAGQAHRENKVNQAELVLSSPDKIMKFWFKSEGRETDLQLRADNIDF